MNDCIKIKHEYLNAFFNLLFQTEIVDFDIYGGFYPKPVFRVQLSLYNNETSNVNFLLNSRSFHDFSMQYSNEIRRELLNLKDIFMLLVMSGIAGYPGFDEFAAKLEQFEQRDFLKGDRPVFVGLDTNLVRDRFYSAHHTLLKSTPLHKIGFSISPYVNDELNYQFKYSADFLKKMLQKLPDSTPRWMKDCIQDFYNQNKLNDRLRRLGFVEIAKMSKSHWVELLPELDPRELNNSPDINIINSYKWAAMERNVDIVLLSRDENFCSQAMGISGIYPIFLETPKIDFGKPEYQVDGWNAIAELLLVAAIAFGFISISINKLKLTMVLQGIWAGKREDDWQNEALLLKVFDESSKKYFKILKKDLEVIANLQKWNLNCDTRE